jgi:Domain of unknown function (DUF4604)
MAPKEPTKHQLSSRLTYSQHTPAFLRKLQSRVSGVPGEDSDENEDLEFEDDGSGRPPIPRRPPIPERPADNPGSGDEEEDRDDEAPQVVVLKEGKHLSAWEVENEKRKGECSTCLSPVSMSATSSVVNSFVYSFIFPFFFCFNFPFLFHTPKPRAFLLCPIRRRRRCRREMPRTQKRSKRRPARKITNPFRFPPARLTRPGRPRRSPNGRPSSSVMAVARTKERAIIRCRASEWAVRRLRRKSRRRRSPRSACRSRMMREPWGDPRPGVWCIYYRARLVIDSWCVCVNMQMPDTTLEPPLWWLSDCDSFFFLWRIP